MDQRKRRRIDRHRHLMPYVPPEIVGLIFQFLNPRDRRLSRLVSRRWCFVSQFHDLCFKSCKKLHGHCLMTNLDAINFVCRHGADPNESLSRSDLCELCRLGDVEMIRLLLSYGTSFYFASLERPPMPHLSYGNAKIRCAAHIDQCALHEACHYGRSEIARVLLESDQRFSSEYDVQSCIVGTRFKYTYVDTIVPCVIFDDDIEIFHLLLEYGAKPIPFAATGFLGACQNGHMNMVRCVQRYWDITGVCEEGIRVAEENGHTEIVQFLQNRDTKCDR